MFCPFCKSDMKLGIIHGDRYPIKWTPIEKDKGSLLSIISKGIKVTGALDTNHKKCYLCENCDKIIIDLLSNFD